MLLKPQRFEFRDFLLDTKEKVLLHRGQPVSITPKIYELLLVLLENHGHLIEKNELLNRVWADSFVEESNLTFTIARIRKILGDDARKPKFIETVPRRGYRFIADVKIRSKTPPDARTETGPNEDRSPERRYSGGRVATKKQRFYRPLLFVAAFSLATAMILIISAFWPERSKTDDFADFSFTPLKFNAKSLSIALSPDGRYFAYTEESNEKLSLWLQEIETSKKKQIVPPGDYFYFGLAFSSNGKFVYFVRRKQIGTNHADIYRVTADGGKAEKIIEHSEGSINLSPDDRRICFVRTDSNANYTLYLADADGKNERPLVTKKRPESISANRFSPDGRKIAYSSGQADEGSNDHHIVEIDLSDNSKRRITRRGFFHIRSLAWLPDGRSLLITASEISGKAHKIWQLSTETGDALALTDDQVIYNELSAERTGRRILVSKLKNSFQVFYSSIAEPYDRKVLAPALNARFLSDKEITYTNEDGQIKNIDVSGERQTQLTNNNARNLYALISPDGRYIYFMSNQGGTNQIWRMEADGKNPIPITRTVGGFPKFVGGADGHLFYESNLYGTIWKVPADGSGVEKEVWGKRLLFSRFSADGTKMAYLHFNENANRRLDIEITGLKDQKLIKRISPALEGHRPVRLDWAADGKSLFYVTRNDTGYRLWKQRVDRYSPKEFVGNLGTDQIRDFSVSPNGKNFLLVSGEWLRDVILIERGKK